MIRQKQTVSELAPLVEQICGQGSLDELIPRLSRNQAVIRQIEGAIQSLHTTHELISSDARKLDRMAADTVHLVLTSPPYWTLKRYNEGLGQLGHVDNYEEFLTGLDQVWRHCYRALVPGGRLICVVGDVCLSRRRNNGRHTVVPLHAAIQERCRLIGFDNLSPIIWHKIANAQYEVAGNSAGFLGKPYEPNAVIKNDIEFILMQRKPGGYRSPTRNERALSIISADNYQLWFRQIWSDITGASTRAHPAPYPSALAERLIRMFSFVGDTVLDPFVGTGTTCVAAGRWGRSSIGVEIDAQYFKMARDRIAHELGDLYLSSELVVTA